MDHWSQKYVGRRYDATTYNCTHLVAEVARRHLGLSVILPDQQEWRGTDPADVAQLGFDYAEEVSTPSEFDVVLMRLRGRRRTVGSHIGIHSMVADQAWVLHNIERMGVTFVPESRLQSMFLERVGYYRWKFPSRTAAR